MWGMEMIDKEFLDKIEKLEQRIEKLEQRIEKLEQTKNTELRGIYEDKFDKILNELVEVNYNNLKN